MNRVWMDFPRQKLLKSNGKPNLLLNYLRIDKRRRYKEFYEQVNTKLRLNLMAKVFDHLFVIGARIRKFRVRLLRNYVGKVLASLVLALKRQRWTRNLITQRSIYRQTTLIADIFACLRNFSHQQRLIRFKTEQIRNLRAFNNAKAHFD